jgi:uncharacterized membrane protein
MSRDLRHYLEVIRTSYWFLPSVMTAVAIALATATIELDQSLDSASDWDANWFYSGSAEGARQLLATVAGSMITVAGVVFSVTVVGLSLASNQFGPRLLRNFMRDRGNQIVLGTFISTYVYCLLVLRTVRGQDGINFVPQVSITTAVGLALVSVGVLIFFIHHAAMSMQAPIIIANVSHELEQAIDAMFPNAVDEDTVREREDTGSIGQPAEIITSTSDGYIEIIDHDALFRIASECDLVLRVLRRPGHFVATGDALVDVHSIAAQGPDHDRVRNEFTVGSQQTPAQDIEFIINQLVEVAVRALSPSVNDPLTAITCVDFLGAALVRVAGKKMSPVCRCDEAGRLRLVVYPVSFGDLVDVSFRQIRQYGRSSPAVVTRMLETIATVVRQTRQRDDCTILLGQARTIYESAQGFQEIDRRDVDERFQLAAEAAVTRLRELDEVEQPGARRDKSGRKETVQ